jgi:hypothetical protein
MASNKRSLKAFMRPDTQEIVKVPAPESFPGEDLEIRVLSQAEISRLHKMYTQKSISLDKNRNPHVHQGEAVWRVERDSVKAGNHMLVEALVWPDLKDKEMMEHYGCIDVTDMPSLVFNKPGEYAYVNRMVLIALGLAEATAEERNVDKLVDEAKN